MNDVILIYDKSNLENVVERPVLSIQDFKNRIREYFPDYDPNTHIISEIRFVNPILSGNELREMTKDELYTAGKYTLASNEIIEKGKIKTVELSEFEYIENNKIKLDRDKKIEKLKKELYDLRLQKEKKPFKIMINGTEYLQYNRTIDQSNITKIMFSLILNYAFTLLKKFAAGQKMELTKILNDLMVTKYDGWKFYMPDGSEKYERVSVSDFVDMGNTMQKHTSVSMQSETVLSHSLKDMNDDQLKTFDPATEYEKFWEKAMKEGE